MSQVLIVDDIEGVHEMLDLVFEDTGVTLVHALSGEQALRIFLEQPIDLVLTDIEMPRMSGLELFAQLKQADPRVVVVMMTAAESKDFVLRALRLGAFDYIEKPYDEEDLISTVRRGIEERQQRLRLATANGQHPELAEELERLRAELESHEEAQARAEELASELALVKEELASHKKQEHDLQARLSELQLKEGAMSAMEAVMKERMAAIKQAGQQTGGISAEAQAELQRLKEELDAKEAELQVMETGILEREQFLQESEESLFEKGQRLQEIETELEQMREDLEKQGAGAGGGSGGLSPEELAEIEVMRTRIKEKEDELAVREKSLAKTEKLIRAREQFLAQSETILFGDKDDD